MDIFNKHNVKSKFYAIVLTIVILSSNILVASAQEGEKLFLPLIFSPQDDNISAQASTESMDRRGDGNTLQEIETVESDLVTIQDVQNSEEGLIASLVWQEEAGGLPEGFLLTLLDQSNQELISLEIHPQELGEIVTEALPDISPFIEQNGLQYWVAIKDSSSQIIAQQPFRLTFSCASPEECTLEVFSGIYTEALLMSRELDRALDEIEANNPDTTDALQDVISLHPELSGEVYALSLQMSLIDDSQQTEQMSSARRTQQSRCLCWHVAVVNRNPNGLRVFKNGSSPAEAAGFEGRGANHYFGARSRGGSINHAFSGQVELTMKMRCWGFTGWTWITRIIRIGRWFSWRISVRVPQFGWCSQQCQGTVNHQLLNYHADTRAEFDTNALFSTGNAFAFEEVEYRVNGSPITMPKSFAFAMAFAGNSFQQDDIPLTSLSQNAPLPSTSSLNATGFVEVNAGELEEAYADVVNTYSMRAIASAPCALPRTLSSTVSLIVSGTLPPTSLSFYDQLFHRNYLQRTLLP